MADPLSEDAEYVVVMQRGRLTLLLSQRGHFEDPGPVRVICHGQIRESQEGARPARLDAA